MKNATTAAIAPALSPKVSASNPCTVHALHNGGEQAGNQAAAKALVDAVDDVARRALSAHRRNGESDDCSSMTRPRVSCHELHPRHRPRLVGAPFGRCPATEGRPEATVSPLQGSFDVTESGSESARHSSRGPRGRIGSRLWCGRPACTGLGWRGERAVRWTAMQAGGLHHKRDSLPEAKEAEQQLTADAPKGAPLKHGVGLSSRVHRRATRPAVPAAASAVDCGAGVPPARGWVGGGESGPMDRYAGRRPTPQERFPPDRTDRQH